LDELITIRLKDITNINSITFSIKSITTKSIFSSIVELKILTNDLEFDTKF